MIEHIINIFAPLHCVSCDRVGALFCDTCKPPLSPLLEACHFCKISGMTVCNDCQKTTGLSGLYGATEYKANAQSVVHALKYGRSRAAARYMADALVEAHPALFLQGNLCYLPTVNARVRQRGYDQAAIITKELMRRTMLPSFPLLARYKDTRQVGASRTQRQQNMTQAFYVRAAHIPQQTPIILVDDVITTGASMRAAAMLLRQYTDAPIIAVSYAVRP